MDSSRAAKVVLASEQPRTAKSSHIRPRAELQETRRRAAHPLRSWGASIILEHGTLLWSGGYLQASLHPSPDGSDRGWMSMVSEHSAAMAGASHAEPTSPCVKRTARTYQKAT